MKTIFALILISLLITNCKSDGASNSGSTSDTDCQLCGDYIPNEKTSLGPRAIAILDAEPSMEEFYSGKTSSGAKMFNDSQLFFAIRAYVHAMTVTNDFNTLCTELNATFLDFGIANSIVTITGNNHNFAPGGTYCMLEAHLPNGNIAVDVILNRTFTAESGYPPWDDVRSNIRSSSPWLSVSELMYAINNDMINKFNVSPDGFSNAYGGWIVPSNGTFYHTFEDEGFANDGTGKDLLNDFHSSVFINAN